VTTPRGLRAFGHPLHAALVHVPLALLGLAPLLTGAGLFAGRAAWLELGRLALLGGLIGAVPAALAGAWDLFSLPPAHPAWPAGQRHLLSVGTALLLFVAAAAAPRLGSSPVVVLALEGAGVAVLAYAGWSGGELVFRHGVGRTDGA
jgi:uncharacterized membrane protein